MSRFLSTSALLVIGALAGCATYPVPSAHLDRSVAALRSAEAAGARSDPHAAVPLKLAEEETRQATTLMESGRNERADFVLSRAEADAALAQQLAVEGAARARAIDSRARAQAAETGAPPEEQSR